MRGGYAGVVARGHGLRGCDAGAGSRSEASKASSRFQCAHVCVPACRPALQATWSQVSSRLGTAARQHRAWRCLRKLRQGPGRRDRAPVTQRSPAAAAARLQPLPAIPVVQPIGGGERGGGVLRAQDAHGLYPLPVTVSVSADIVMIKPNSIVGDSDAILVSQTHSRRQPAFVVASNKLPAMHAASSRPRELVQCNNMHSCMPCTRAWHCVG